MKVADTDGDGKVSLKEFIFVLNSVHSSSDSTADHQMSMPRILVEKEQPSLADNNNQNFGETMSCFPDRSQLPTVIEEDNRTEKELRFTRGNSISGRRPSVCYKNAAKRKNHVIAWIKQAEVNTDHVETVAALDNNMSSTSSMASSPISSNTNLKKRRKSSISRTLRHGRDALIATARTLRKISR